MGAELGEEWLEEEDGPIKNLDIVKRLYQLVQEKSGGICVGAGHAGRR